MATDFTPNYNLDKYTATDKPNLRDQYNAAMDKIDAALLSANTNATEAKAITQGFEVDIESKAEQTDLDALSALLPSGQFSAQNTIKAALDAKASTTALNAKASQTDLDALKALLPATQFSAQNTIKAALDAKASTTALNSKADKTEVTAEATARANADSGLSSSIIKVSGYGTNIQHKRIVVIGDSLSKYNPLANNWPDYIRATFGCPIYSFAVGSTGFVVGNPTFLQQLQNAHNSTQFNDDNITDVVICGGVNDYAQTTETVRNAVYSCLDYAKSTFSNATIHVGAMLHGSNPLDTLNATNPPSRLISTIQNATLIDNCVWIEGCWNWCVGQTYFDYGDGLHVNETGQRYIAGLMATHLSGGSTQRTISEKLTIVNTAQSWVQNLDAWAYASNGVVNISGNFKYNPSGTPSTYTSNIARLPEWAQSSHGNHATAVVTTTAQSTPAQGSTLSTRYPLVYAFRSSGTEWLGVQQLQEEAHNTVLYFNLTYPFGL